MIYTEKFKIPLKDIGKDNKIKNRAVLEILENIACYHSDLVGYGVNNIKETNIGILATVEQGKGEVLVIEIPENYQTKK